MRIVIFHGRLTSLTGGEVNTRDWALALKSRGHRVVIFTVYPGPLAEQIRRAGIAIVDDPAAISDPPDILFGAGVNDVATLLARFPDVPAIQVAQIWDHWNCYPCPLPQIVLHVAVDELNAEMLINEFGIPRERVRLIYNAVDVQRLPTRRAPLPPRPARALVIVKHVGSHVETMRAACAAHGIAVDFVGYPTGQPVEDPLAAMVDCDLVIGSARTALEGAVAGAAVVVADQRGLAGLLTTANLDHFRRNNFGREVLNRRLDVASLGAEIDRYDPADAAAVSEALRQEATLERQAELLEAAFAEAIALFRRAPPSAEESRKALATYLAAHLPRPAAGDPAPRHVRFPPNPWIDEKLAAIENRLAETREQIAALGGQLATAAEQAASDRRSLAAMAQEGEAFDRRLSTVADHAAAMQQQLSSTAEQVTAVHERLSPTAEQVTALHERLSSTAEQVAGLHERLSSTAEQVAALHERLSSTAEQVIAMHQHLLAVDAQVSSVRPLIRLLRPLAVVLSRVWRLRRFAGWHSLKVQR